MNAPGRTSLDWTRGLARPVFYLGNNRISQLGVMLTTASAITLISFYTTEFFGTHVGPYVGIITFLVLPAIFVLGLLLIPAGMYLRRRREIRAGVLPATYPQIDLGDPKLRETLWFVVAMTGVNLALILTATYRGVHYMDSVQFCGLTCHTVMQPEYTAYQGSPHSRIACVGCHIGPGAPWFVRAKISGAYQVLSVTFDLYSRPIPTPIENLRPAQETCEQCHWPLKFHGDKVTVKSRFAEDEQSSQTQTVLLMRTGGIDPWTRQPVGIHGYHLEPGTEIHYLTTDPQRQEIPVVYYVRADGTLLEYRNTTVELTDEQLVAAERRRMDCMDCHNRPTHTFQMPGAAVDSSMAAGRIDSSLPFIKKQALELLQLSYASQAEAESQIRTRLRNFYRESHKELFDLERPKIEETADTLVGIYQRNVFPQMNVFWGTYPNNLGHDPFPGCFRCHDGLHSTADGEHTIPADCTTCHVLLAYEEATPEILKTLRGD